MGWFGLGLSGRQLLLRDPSLREARRDAVLLVWSELAHWMVVDREMEQFLSRFDGKRTVEEILEKVDRQARGLRQVVRGLAERAVLVEAGKTLGGVRDDRTIENVTINLTRRCSLACRHCYLGRSTSVGAEVGADEIAGFLRDVRGLCAQQASLMILGGEPTLEAGKLLTVARVGRELGFDVLVSTNGQHVTADLARGLVAMGAGVQVSLDGATQATNDAIRGAGSFVKAVDGVRRLGEAGVGVILSMVVTRENRGEMRQYMELAKWLGAAEARFIPLRSTGEARGLGAQVVPLSELLEEVRDILKSQPQWRRLLGRDVFSILCHTCRLSERRVSCGTGRKTILLDADGSLYPCGNLNHAGVCFGSIRQEGFVLREAWETSQVLNRVREETAIDRMAEPCPTCAVRYWCLGGCRGEAYGATGGLDAPSPHCEQLRRSVVEMFWYLAEEPELAGRAVRAC